MRQVILLSLASIFCAEAAWTDEQTIDLVNKTEFGIVRAWFSPPKAGKAGVCLEHEGRDR